MSESKKYSFEAAQNEAAEMRTKIQDGEAENYDDAELAINIEAAESKMTERMVIVFRMMQDLYDKYKFLTDIGLPDALHQTYERVGRILAAGEDALVNGKPMDPIPEPLMKEVEWFVGEVDRIKTIQTEIREDINFMLTTIRSYVDRNELESKFFVSVHDRLGNESFLVGLNSSDSVVIENYKRLHHFSVYGRSDIIIPLKNLLKTYERMYWVFHNLGDTLNHMGEIIDNNNANIAYDGRDGTSCYRKTNFQKLDEDKRRGEIHLPGKEGTYEYNDLSDDEKAKFDRNLDGSKLPWERKFDWTNNLS